MDASAGGSPWSLSPLNKRRLSVGILPVPLPGQRGRSSTVVRIVYSAWCPVRRRRGRSAYHATHAMSSCTPRGIAEAPRVGRGKQSRSRGRSSWCVVCSALWMCCVVLGLLSLSSFFFVFLDINKYRGTARPELGERLSKLKTDKSGIVLEDRLWSGM